MDFPLRIAIGRVKAVPSGDSLVIVSNQAGILTQRTLYLSCVKAPKLGAPDSTTPDEPFAWASREYLRKLCHGKEVSYRGEYATQSQGSLFVFGSAFLGNYNVAALVVSQGWACVTGPRTALTYNDLLLDQERAFNLGLGRWSRIPGVAEAFIRPIPPPETTQSLLDANKGISLEAIVEQVLDCTNVKVCLLPKFQIVEVLVVGAKTPGMSPYASLAIEATFFAETRVLHKDVRIVLKGLDKEGKLIGSVYYSDGDAEKDLGLELMENGYAKYVEWSAKFMDEDARRQLKNAEIEAKKNKLRIWRYHCLPPTNSKPIHDQDFTGIVVEVISGDCVIVADDHTEKRVNLSSIWCSKSRRGENQDAYAREAKELLRTHLIGRQVNVQMEYSRTVGQADGTTDSSRVVDFGSVFFKGEGEDASNQAEKNVGELVVAHGLGKVIRHREFEERSGYYDTLLAAESSAIAAKKGLHSSSRESSVIADLTMATDKITQELLPSFTSRRVSAVVEYVFSGHRFKLYIPEVSCCIPFSFSGVRCPGRDEPYSDEAIKVMKRRVMQRDVEIEVVTVDRSGTFLGTLWESGVNVSVALVEAGLAKYTPFGGSDKNEDGHLLKQAMEVAKTKKLKIWENFEEGNEAILNKQNEELKVVVTEVLDSGRFYVQIVGDQKTASIQQQLASLSLEEAPSANDAFNPRRGDIVLAQFSGDNSWNRARIVNVQRDKFEVFYIDYGNQEAVRYSQLRPLDSSAATAPGLAQLCSLAYINVPSLEENYGQEAAEYFSECTLNSFKEFTAVIEGRDFSGGKVVKGQGTGSALRVTLVASDIVDSINAVMVQNGLAWLDKEKRFWKSSENLKEFQEQARTFRRGMWHNFGYYESDGHENKASAARKATGKR